MANIHSVTDPGPGTWTKVGPHACPQNGGWGVKFHKRDYETVMARM